MKKIFQHFKDLLTHHHVKTATEVATSTATVVVGKAQEIGSDALDVLTRKSTDDEVREHILQQGRYNDILAIKLDEALRRIDALERRLEKK